MMHLAELFRPHHVVERLEKLSYEILLARGIRGVMLDLDNTIVPWRCQQVAPAVETWVAQLEGAGLRACVVTNTMHACRVRPVAERLGLPWVTHAHKPFSFGMRRGMRAMGTTPETSAMIGDLLTMDIIGGNRLGLFTVLVEPMSHHEAWFTRHIQRPIEHFIGRVPRRNAS